MSVHDSRAQLLGTPTMSPVRRTTRAVWSRLRQPALKAAAPLATLIIGLCTWQLVCTLHWSATVPAPGAVWCDIADAWTGGILAPALLHSLQRCGLAFLCSVGLGGAMALLLFRFNPLRLAVSPVLNAIQSLPAAALVPAVVLCLGTSESAVYCVAMLGAVPSIVIGIFSALDQVPPLFLRAGRSMGATGLIGARHILIPAAMPGIVAALKQGWTFGWRALMTAELITSTLPGIGQLLDTGRRTGSLSLVLAVTILILAVGVVIEVVVFRPVERSILRKRGLPGSDGSNGQ